MATRTRSTDDALSDPGTVVSASRGIVARWRLLLILFVLFAVAGVGLVAIQPTTYDSTAVLAFQPATDQAVSADLVTLLAQRYPELVSSQDAVAGAADAAGVSAAQVESGLNAQIPPLTLNLVISVKLPSPSDAQEATTYLVGLVRAEDARDPYLSAITVASPSQSQSPSGLPRTLLFALAIVSAAVLALLVTAIVDAFRRRPADADPLDQVD